MHILKRLKSTPLWLMVPSLAVAGAAGAVAHGYQPLVFDPSLYDTPSADAAELKTIDADALEAKGEASTLGGDESDAVLSDGTWTGYAPCGKGNPDGWKPYYVAVTIEVDGGKVARIVKVAGSSSGGAGAPKLDWDAAENQSYLDMAVKGNASNAGVKTQMDKLLAAGSAVSGIDTVSGATYSSTAVYNAYLDARDKAAGTSGTGKKAVAKASKKKSTKVAAPATVGVLADGTWTGYSKCGPDPSQPSWKEPYYVGVTLTVAGGKVGSLDRVFASPTAEQGDPVLTWDEAENKQYLDGAVSGVGAQIRAAVSSGTVLGSIDTVSGATYSSKAVFEAYYAALKKSAAAAGSALAPSQPAAPGTAGEAGQHDDETDAAEGFYGFSLCQNSASSSDSWSPYYLFVKVAASQGSVTRISSVYGDKDGLVDPAFVYSASENATYLDWAVSGKFGGIGYRMKSVVQQINEKLAAGSAISGISTVSGATRSSNSIVTAYKMAAENAQNDVGKTPEEAVDLVREQSR